MKAFVGELYKEQGSVEKANSNFAAALAVPQPADAGEMQGRALLDSLIRARMNGGSNLLKSAAFSGCHSCHLSVTDKLVR